jgi:hypothetical protein
MQDLGRPRQITLELGGQDAAVLYGSPQELVVMPDPAYDASQPTPGSDGSGGIGAQLPTLRPWSTGHYAVAFAFAWDGAEVVRWLGINLLPGPGEPR